MIKNITNLGDSALYCDFGEKINKEINLNVINFFKNLQKLKIKGITNISPSYNNNNFFLKIFLKYLLVKYLSLKKVYLNLE